MKKWLKKGFHKFVFSENGAVSIYAIIMTLLLFVFNAVLIDYIRIMTAERNVDQAAKAAARSTMANFNQKLTTDYGLFGFDGAQGDANEIFEKVFRENLAPSQEDDIFNFAYPSYVSGSANVTFKENMNLASPETAEYQILEDMKYKAPIEIGQSVIEGFLSISKEVKESSEYAEVAKEVQEQVEKRDELIERAEEEMNQAYDIIRSLNGRITDPGEASFPEVNNINDIPRHLKEYREIKEAEEAAEESDGDDEESEVEGPSDEELNNADKFVDNAKEFVSSLSDDVGYFKSHLVIVKVKMEEAKEHNTEARNLLDSSDKSGDYDNATNAANDLNLNVGTQVDGGDASSGVETAKSELEKLIFPDEFFDKVIEETRNTIEMLDDSTSSLPNRITQIEDMLNQNAQLKSSTGESWFNTGNDNTKNAFTEVREAFSSAYNALLEKPEVESDYSKEKVDEEEEKADEAYDEATKEVDDVLKEVEGAIGDAIKYEDLINLAQDYIQFAEGAEASRELERDQESKEDLTDDALNFVDKLFNSIGDGLLNKRDKLYLNEYILLKFNSHDFSKKDASAFGINNNEVEYIMYGLDSSGENFAAAMMELFVFRFVINFVEAFTRPEVIAFGPYALIPALRSALTETAKDIGDFIQNKDVFFFKEFPFSPKYKDYLRIFMLYHGEGNKVPRMMARIHQQTNKNLLEMPTYIEGEAEASVNLWFLPGITEMLGKANILDGNVENGEFRIKKKSVYSY